MVRRAEGATCSSTVHTAQSAGSGGGRSRLAVSCIAVDRLGIGSEGGRTAFVAMAGTLAVVAIPICQ